MKTLGSRILNSILENERLNPNQFAESIGLSRTQPIYDILNGKVKKITTNYASKILDKYPDYNYSWLLTGEGPMLKESIDKPFVNEFTPVPEGEYMMVEYADLRVSAGRLGGGDVAQLPDTHRRLVPKEYAKGGFLVIRVDGDSMDDGTKRSLSDGDEVLVYEKTDNHLEDLPIRKTVFVITSREGNVIKQIKEINREGGYIICHSFNPRYEDYKMAISDIYQIFVVCKVVQKQISLI